MENIIEHIDKITSKNFKNKCHLFTISKFTYSITDLIGTTSTSISSREYCDIKSDKTTEKFINNFVKIISEQLKKNYKVILFGHSYGGYIVNKIAEKIPKSNKNLFNDRLFIRTLNSIYISKNLTLNQENIIHFYHKNDVAYNRITKYCIKSDDNIYKRIIFYGEKQKLSFLQKKMIVGTKKQWKDHTESFYFIFSFVLCYDLINFFIIHKLQINNNRLKNSNNNYNYWNEKHKIQGNQSELTKKFLISRNSNYKGSNIRESTESLTNSTKSSLNFSNNVCELIDENNLKWLDNISCNNIKTLKTVKNKKNNKSYDKSISHFRQIIYSDSINKLINKLYMYSVDFNLHFFLLINFIKLKNNNSLITRLELQSFKYISYPTLYNIYNKNLYSINNNLSKIKLIKNTN